MPALTTTVLPLPWASSSPLPVKLCFSMRSQKLSASSSAAAHLLGRTSRALPLAATAATGTAFCDEQQTVQLMRHLDEDGWVEDQILPLLTPVEAAWQPADLLPSFAAPVAEQRSQVAELQARAAGVPDELLVCLVGNMVTEEGLPAYMTMGNRVARGANDGSVCDGTVWARWLRGWTAEENRHGDLLNRYLYLCGRVDMRQVEKTVHHLLRGGMRMLQPSCPYHAFIYSSFQERATFVSHAHTARLAVLHGESCLSRQALRGHRRRREAPRDRVHQGRRQVLRGRPGRCRSCARRRHARQGHHARRAHGRRPRREPLRSLLRGGAARGGVLGQGLRRHGGALRAQVGRAGARGADRRRAARAGLRVRAAAQDPKDGGASPRPRGPEGGPIRKLQLGIRQAPPSPLKGHLNYLTQGDPRLLLLSTAAGAFPWKL